ncbi:hypothetical protein MMC07_001831 [Pseudocyphellaria aurata]|nr:hypothetical protein [Pseudocyphellaria aurata]
MHPVKSFSPLICTGGRHKLSRPVFRDKTNVNPFRRLSGPEISPPQQGRSSAQNISKNGDGETNCGNHHVEEAGGMTRRLAQITDECLEQDGRSAQNAIKEGGFSEELQRRLEAKFLDNKFKSDNPAAFAQLNVAPGAGRGTRAMAGAQPWTGTEAVEDAALRMLTDAHKPLRGTGSARIPIPGGSRISVDMRMKKAVRKSQGQLLASARDRTSAYALSQDPSLSEHEKEQMRKELKERFTPGARPMPGTVQGLAALANERIEDAIARGQFRNIARGKGKNIERDYTASSPFLDTTEYFLNKIIQKQEIVPPWIEKQQELVKETAVFRARLRADWKRHAVRVIASKGDSLEEQARRARAYAAAEMNIKSKLRKVEALDGIDEEGKISDVTMTEIPTPSENPENSPLQVTITEDAIVPTEAPAALSSTTNTISPSPILHSSPSDLTLPPFRDQAWESLEHAYHALAISSLNSLTRSYNLQAPDLAKKPYFSLSRELAACFADVAPQLATEVLERARAPQVASGEGKKTRQKGVGGVLERLAGDTARVVDSTRPHYGFRQFWKEFWSGEVKV